MDSVEGGAWRQEYGGKFRAGRQLADDAQYGLGPLGLTHAKSLTVWLAIMTMIKSQTLQPILLESSYTYVRRDEVNGRWQICLEVE